MLKFESFGDMFKQSNEFLIDDFNHGQALVVKTKQKSSDGISVGFIFK